MRRRTHLLKTEYERRCKELGEQYRAAMEAIKASEDETTVLFWLDEFRALNSSKPGLLKKAYTAAKAMLTAGKVDNETFRRRLAICATCDWLDRDEPGNPRCGVCGCRVGPNGSRILNLAAYEEGLPEWGCKHPDRESGKGWPVCVIPLVVTEPSSDLS